MAKTIPLVIDEKLRTLVEQYAELNGLTFDQALNELARDAVAFTRGTLRDLLNRYQVQPRRVH